MISFVLNFLYQTDVIDKICTFGFRIAWFLKRVKFIFLVGHFFLVTGTEEVLQVDLFKNVLHSWENLKSLLKFF